MTSWVCVAVWLVGWLLAVRPSMRRTMLQEVCSKCRADVCDCASSARVFGQDPPPLAARGALRDRTGGDVAWSVFSAAWWPVRLAFVVLRAALRALGAGVKTAVIRATPLTAPELERRITERDAEIARLTAQISEGPPSPPKPPRPPGPRPVG